MTTDTIKVENLGAKIFNDFMRWGGIGTTIDFNGLMQIIGELEKKGYVVVVDCEKTYLHYPHNSNKKSLKFQYFTNTPKIFGVYNACLEAVKHWYHY